jgi:PPOX class probable F420-dependent enzyme
MPELSDDLLALLAGRRYATLATYDRDDTIHLTPVWFLFDGRRFFFGSSSESRKIENLRRKALASVVVDARRPASECWVSASGTTEILTGEEALAINMSIRRRYLTQAAIDDARVGPVFAAGDDAAIRLTPTRWRSWTVRDLDERSFGGILGRTPDHWFLPVDV